MTMLISLLLIAPQDSQQVSTDALQSAQVIYYDYLEDGILKGGVVPVDPNNPLHVDLRSAGQDRFRSSANAVTLLDNGRSDNRIDLVFVGDGYTASEQANFAQDVDGIWPVFFSEPPFDQYSTYFNIHRVDVVSNESGVDNDPVQGIQRDTAMDMEYFCGGTARLLCVDVGSANLYAGMARDADQVLAIANSTTYGGAGYTNLGTLSGKNGAAIEIALHEFGHAFGRLADEYSYGGSTTYTGNEPMERNVTILDEASLIAGKKKWYYWLNDPAIATFEGAKYSVFGIFRPRQDSKMRNLNVPFYEVNTEELIMRMYRKVNPIDDASPAGIYSELDSLWVEPMRPVGHNLSIQWSLDGLAIPGATSETFQPHTLGLPKGIHTLSVEVKDQTTLVRAGGPRRAGLSSTRSWTLITYGVYGIRPKGPGPILTR